MGTAREVVDRFYDAFNGRRVNKEEGAKLFEPSLESIDPSGTYNGIEAFLAYVQGYVTAAPDSKISLRHIVETGDVVLCEGEFTGTNTGPLASPQGTMPATGKRFVLKFADVFEVKNDKIAKHRTYYDQMAFLGQLGLLPQPASTH